jgi:hypothetical protein
MEQTMQTQTLPGLTGRQDKWVDGVLKLIHLTQTGGLVWTPTDPADSAFVYAYRAEFEGNILLLERTLLVDVNSNIKDPLNTILSGLLKMGMSEKIVLRVSKPDGTLLTRFPMIPPLRSLAAAVESQVSRESDTFLESLSAA